MDIGEDVGRDIVMTELRPARTYNVANTAARSVGGGATAGSPRGLSEGTERNDDSKSRTAPIDAAGTDAERTGSTSSCDLEGEGLRGRKFMLDYA